MASKDRRLTPLVLLAVLALTGAGCAVRPAAEYPPMEPDVAEERSGLLISNVRVFDAAAGTFSEPAGILIRHGRIHAGGSFGDMGKPEEEIDARGAFALPGLWDSHVHLDFTSLEGPDAVRKTLEGFVQAGVLYLRDVGAPLEVVVDPGPPFYQDLQIDTALAAGIRVAAPRARLRPAQPDRLLLGDARGRWSEWSSVPPRGRGEAARSSAPCWWTPPFQGRSASHDGLLSTKTAFIRPIGSV
jgi:hypothetical protein